MVRRDLAWECQNNVPIFENVFAIAGRDRRSLAAAEQGPNQPAAGRDSSGSAEVGCDTNRSGRDVPVFALALAAPRRLARQLPRFGPIWVDAKLSRIWIV